MTPGEIIKNYRKKCNLTLEQAATLWNMRASNLSRIERGKTVVSELTALKIEKFTRKGLLACDLCPALEPLRALSKGDR